MCLFALTDVVNNVFLTLIATNMKVIVEKNTVNKWPSTQSDWQEEYLFISAVANYTQVVGKKNMIKSGHLHMSDWQ